jgi:hypothetical protein
MITKRLHWIDKKIDFSYLLCVQPSQIARKKNIEEASYF